ncbi:glycosyltransferase family 2 protein, partial [Bacteroidota bacterium]
QKNYFQRYPTILQFVLFHSIFAKPFYKFPKLMNRYLENQDIALDSKRVEFIEQIPCAFFLTNRSVFEQAGKMDENYYLFFEDVDLSYQINKKYKLAIDTSLRVTHLGGVSFQNDDNWWLYGRFIMSMNYFFDKNYNWLRAFLLKAFSVTNSLLVIFIEYAKKIFGKSGEYRLKKHKYFLKEFKKYYL